MNKRQATFVGLTIVIVSVVVIAVLFMGRTPPPKKVQQNTAPLVDTVLPSIETVTLSVTSHGVVQPRTETTLVTEVSGVIQSVSERFVPGGYFKKGDLLLRIDPSDYQVAVEQARARLASSVAQFQQEKARTEQAQKEWDLSGRSRANAPAIALREPFLLEAEANRQSAEADLKKAEQKLARTIIRAPYDGMVKSKLTDVGQFVGTGTQLGVTFAIDYAEVRLPLTDKDLAYINVPEWGSKKEMSTPVVLSAAYAGQLIEWQALLVRMEGVVDQQSRVHYAVARITDPYSVINEGQHPAPLKIGTFITAKIQGKEIVDVLKIPRKLLRDLNKVLVSDDESKLAIRELDLVRSDVDYIYARASLTSGDQLVTTVFESPVIGTKVRISGQSDDNSESEPPKAIAEQADETEPR